MAVGWTNILQSCIISSYYSTQEVLEWVCRPSKSLFSSPMEWRQDVAPKSFVVLWLAALVVRLAHSHYVTRLQWAQNKEQAIHNYNFCIVVVPLLINFAAYTDRNKYTEICGFHGSESIFGSREFLAFVLFFWIIISSDSCLLGCDTRLHGVTTESS